MAYRIEIEDILRGALGLALEGGMTRDDIVCVLDAEIQVIERATAERAGQLEDGE